MRTFRTIMHPISACKKYRYEVQEQIGLSARFFSSWKTLETCDSAEDAKNYVFSRAEKVNYIGMYEPDGCHVANEPTFALFPN